MILWDYDIPCPPDLVTVRARGPQDRCRRPSHQSGEPIPPRVRRASPFPVEERRAEVETSGGTELAHPALPDQTTCIAEQRFTEAEVADLSSAARTAVLGAAERDAGRATSSCRRDCSLPSRFRSSMVEASGAAALGRSGEVPRLFYVNANNEANGFRWWPRSPQRELTLAELGRRFTPSVCSAHVTDSSRPTTRFRAVPSQTLKTGERPAEQERVLELIEGRPQPDAELRRLYAGRKGGL